MSNIENRSLPTWNAQIGNGFFNTLAIGLIAITLIFFVFVSFVKLPELSREEKEKLPPHLVKIMKSEVEIKPTEPKPELKKEQPKPKEAKPKPKPKPKELEPKPIPKPKPQVVKKEIEKKAKDEAAQSGLLALSAQLSAMRDIAKTVPSAVTSANDGLDQGSAADAKTERIILGQKAAGTSGRATGKRFTDVGQSANLASNQTGQVAQVATAVDTMAQQVAETQAYESVSGKRSSESIRQTFDRNKSAIYSIYRRALRSDPSLEGSVTVKLIILPNGRVSAVSIISSDIDTDDFTAKLLRRIRLINFSPKPVAETELEYTFNFLPF